jgi:hypothetical protein
LRATSASLRRLSAIFATLLTILNLGLGSTFANAADPALVAVAEKEGQVFAYSLLRGAPSPQGLPRLDSVKLMPLDLKRALADQKKLIAWWQDVTGIQERSDPASHPAESASAPDRPKA